jgi:uncharacterized protein YceK
MIKKLFFSIIIFLSILLSGCSSITDSPKIIPPKSTSNLIEGKWQSDTADSLKCIQFTPEFAVIGSSIYSRPRYRVRKVSTSQYLTYYSNSSYLKSIEIPEEALVVTVTSGQNFIGEFMELNSEQVLANINNTFMQFKRVSAKADAAYYEKADTASNAADHKDVEDPELRSVLLIGIHNNIGSYETYCISSENRKLHPILQGNGIFVPRKKGFASFKNPYFAGKNRTVLFIGNDYVSTEVTPKDDSPKTLQLLPVDKMNNAQGIKISDIFGDAGVNAMKDEFSSANPEIDASNIDMSNFGLYRKSGHWVVKGRINYLKNGYGRFADQDLNLVPSARIVFYDTLQIPWNEIKDKVPDAEDAVTSPNKDIAVIFTQNKILIYPIVNGRLSGTALSKTSLQEGYSVVMSEWATGSYMKEWENSFKNFAK